MTCGKRRSYDRWQFTALLVGVLTLKYGASAYAQSAEYIYWADLGTNSIRRANLDGSNEGDFITGLIDIRGIALDLTNNYIYWAQKNQNKIMRADLDDPTNVTDLNSLTPSLFSPSSPMGIALSSRYIYWVEFSNDLVRADLNGDNQLDLIDNTVVSGRYIALDEGDNRMYWAESSRIRRANLDDGDNVDALDEISPAVSGAEGIALDLINNHDYWSETGKIRRADLDGNNAIDLGINPDPVQARDVALDLVNNHIYWTERNKIRRADLDDPTNVIDLLLTVNNGEGIALQLDENSSSSGRQVRNVPFKSQYVVLALFALLGCWYVVHRPH